MPAAVSLDEVLEASGQLSVEDQETLIGILQRRLALVGRQRCVEDVKQARQEFAVGACRPATPDEIMREILK